jgi:hypothetical protein
VALFTGDEAVDQEEGIAVDGASALTGRAAVRARTADGLDALLPAFGLGLFAPLLVGMPVVRRLRDQPLPELIAALEDAGLSDHVLALEQALWLDGEES